MHDIDVRSALRASLAVEHAGDIDTRIVEEMGVWSGAVRIDVAVINGELCGFELKSDSDTLQRLPAQADLYSRVFDRVTLVAGERHVDAALAIVPDWWGCLIATMTDGVVALRPHRKAESNPSIDPLLVAKLLWKAEAIFALDQRGLARGWRSKSVDEIHERLARELDLQDLCKLVRAALKVREKPLRQTVTRDLQMAVDGVANPHGRIATRNRPGDNVVDLDVAPTLRHGRTLRVSGDVGCMPMKLDSGLNRVGPDRANAVPDQEFVGQRVARIDGKSRRNLAVESVGRDVGVVAKVDQKIEPRLRKRAPKRPLLAIEEGGSDLIAGQHLRDRTASNGHGAPVLSSVKLGKDGRYRDSKGRYVSHRALKIDDEIGVAHTGKPRRRSGRGGRRLG
jgi:hypothetical protein